jgi:hypothetical protein
MRPDERLPSAARNAIDSTPTSNSSMIRRKISGSSTACAWLTAWEIASSQSERIGRISGAAIALSCPMLA